VARAVVLGGTGLVGSAAALRLVTAGWEVACTGRDSRRFPPELLAAGIRFTQSDRYAANDLRAILRRGADLVVDCVGFTAQHSSMLLNHLDSIGSLVFISSKAVYIDGQGRHANSDEPPVFAGPVNEEQPTMTPSAIDYRSREGYGPNKVAAEQVLLDSGAAVSVLRPSRIHGVGGARPREWVFVKRVLDGRRHLLLARGGLGMNHPTAAVNLAALVQFCAQSPGTRILNSADPDAPDGLAISKIIASHLTHSWNEVLLPDTAPTALGDHPWNTLPPFLLDTAVAHQLGFEPIGSYADTVRTELDWLVNAARTGDPNSALPRTGDTYFDQFFDYQQEDRWLTNNHDT